MQQLITPVCLVLCLALLVTGFALLAIDPPQVSMQLHRARLSGDTEYRDMLEADLNRRIWMRRALIAGLFVGAFALGAAAFLGNSGARPWGDRR